MPLDSTPKTYVRTWLCAVVLSSSWPSQFQVVIAQNGTSVYEFTGFTPRDYWAYTWLPWISGIILSRTGPNPDRRGGQENRRCRSFTEEGARNARNKIRTGDFAESDFQCDQMDFFKTPFSSDNGPQKRQASNRE